MVLRLNPYITLDGRTKEAIEFYKQALGAQVAGVITFGEMPEDPGYPLPEAARDRVAHALLKVGETDLMFSDTFPGQPSKVGDNVSICVTTDDPAKTKRIFDALAEGGNAVMPVQETSWSPAYGIVIDKFGVMFQLTTEGKNNG